jgi:hypothetical protein
MPTGSMRLLTENAIRSQNQQAVPQAAVDVRSPIALDVGHRRAAQRAIQLDA